MGTVLIERCPDCNAMVGRGHLYEHQQKACPMTNPKPAEPPSDERRETLDEQLQHEAIYLGEIGCEKWARIMDDARATIQRLTRERDEARAQKESHEEAAVSAETRLFTLPEQH